MSRKSRKQKKRDKKRINRNTQIMSDISALTPRYAKEYSEKYGNFDFTMALLNIKQ